jgi:hypothetical protein
MGRQQDDFKYDLMSNKREGKVRGMYIGQLCSGMQKFYYYSGKIFKELG